MKTYVLLATLASLAMTSHAVADERSIEDQRWIEDQLQRQAGQLRELKNQLATIQMLLLIHIRRQQEEEGKWK